MSKSGGDQESAFPWLQSEWEVQYQPYNHFLEFKESRTLRKRYSSVREDSKLRKQLIEQSYKFSKESESKSKLSDEVIWNLSVLDAFVEKAQFHLTRRARQYSLGAAFAILTSLCFGIAFLLQFQKEVTSDSIELLNQADTSTAILIVLEKLAVGAVYFAGISAPLGLARAYLHEAKVLYSKRHSLRQGRMAAHYSRGTITVEELSKFFAWNIEANSAFLKVPFEKSAKGVIGQMTELTQATANAVDASAEFVKSVQSSAQKENGNSKK